MLPALPVVCLVTAALLLLMLVELQLSVVNERALRARGAVEPSDDVYRLMRVAYPAGFLVIAADALRADALSGNWVLGGVLLLGWAKALKFWAIAHLGPRWSFRVLVLPGQPLVATGPYRWLRHPNYVAVLGEYIAVAVALQAAISGVLVTGCFAWLLLRRIRVEERALGLVTSGETTARPPAS